MEYGKNGRGFVHMNRSLATIFGRRMDRRIFWLRACYWTGAVAVTVAALQMIIPGLSPLQKTANLPNSLYIAGSFVLGWSLLLIWAYRRPHERKGVLLLTLCSVLTAWVTTEIFGVVLSELSVTARLPFWVLQACLSFLFTFSYLQTQRAYPKWWSQRA
jgi:hypothetical protein